MKAGANENTSNGLSLAAAQVSSSHKESGCGVNQYSDYFNQMLSSDGSTFVSF
jgi:hypothetical protein